MPVFTIETPTGTKLDIEAADEAGAMAGAQQWHAENGGAKVNKLTDVAKSAAIGVPSAAIGAAGAAGGARGLASAATDYVGDAIGASPEKVQTFKGVVSKLAPMLPGGMVLRDAPDSDTIQKAVEGYTGKFYEPKTTEGKYAKSVSENVTGALIGPGGLSTKIAQGVGAGLGSQALGDYFTGTLEPYARFAGGLLGGVGAGVGSKAVQGARNTVAAAAAGEELGGMLGGGRIKGAAVDRVAKNLADEELIPGQAATRAQQLGPNAMLMDIGHQLESRADFMAQHSGKAQNTVYKPIAERAEGIAPQLNAVLDKHMGESMDVVRLQNGIDEWSRKHVGPLYKALEEKYPVVNDARLQELAQRPAIQQAAKNAKTIAKDMGEELGAPETRTIISGPGYHIADDIEHAAQPSIRYWDFVKKSLDQRINNMMKGAEESAAAQSTMAAVQQARKDLVRHLDDVTGGEYAQARKLATTKPAMEEALDLGRSVFNNKMLPEQLEEHLHGLSLAERKMVEIGVRREIEHRVGAQGDEGRKLRALIGAPNNSAKLEHLLGPQANREIQNEISAADQFQRMKNKIEGTRTATRTAGMNDTTAPKVNLGVTATGLIGAAPGAAVNYALEHGFSNTRQDIARLLTAKGEKVNPVVQQLLNYNAKKAKNEAAPMGQQAAALIRALMAGGVSQ
jgi:hypothetical protein